MNSFVSAPLLAAINVDFKASALTNKQQHNSGQPHSVNGAGLGSASTKTTHKCGCFHLAVPSG